MAQSSREEPRPAADLPKAIVWDEGMLLAPQHFQQLAVRYEELIGYHAAALNPFHWGLKKLQIDAKALANGVVSVKALEAVMPDGLVVHHERSKDEVLEVSLADMKNALVAAPTKVHLVVAVRRLGGAATAGDEPRYTRLDDETVVDEVTGQSPLEIARWVPALKLFVGDTAPKKYTSFPIAEIVVREEVFTQTDYIPPHLAISEASVLGELCSTLAARIRDKANFLAERIRTSLGQTDKVFMQHTNVTLHGLVSALPAFEAVLKTGRAHPFSLYMTLCQLAGSITVAGGALVPRALKPYDHDDLFASFSEVHDFVSSMLDRISKGHVVVPFEEKDGVFSLMLEPEWCDEDLTIGVRARDEETQASVIDWIGEALIGSSAAIDTMRERRVLGAQRFRIDRDDDLDVMPSRGLVLFKVSAASEDIVPGDVVTILSGDPRRRAPPREVVLYIRAPSDASLSGGEL